MSKPLAEQTEHMRHALHWILMLQPNPRSTIGQMVRQTLDMAPGESLSVEQQKAAEQYARRCAS